MSADLDLDDVADTSPKARQELLELRERIAFLESQEVCTAPHEDVGECGYCQRDRLKTALWGVKRNLLEGELPDRLAINQARAFVNMALRITS